MEIFEKYLILYLIIMNIVGFLIYSVNFLLCRYKGFARADKLIGLLSLAGGSLGILLFIALFDRKSVKENMMSRVFVLCVLIMQIICILFWKGIHREQLTFAFWEFFGKHKLLMIYLAVINIVSFVTFAIDKYNAIKGKSRVRILTLLGIAFVGGSIGGLLGMYTLRHKTRVNYFTVGLPLMLVMHIMILFFVMNL